MYTISISQRINLNFQQKRNDTRVFSLISCSRKRIIDEKSIKLSPKSWRSVLFLASLSFYSIPLFFTSFVLIYFFAFFPTLFRRRFSGRVLASWRGSMDSIAASYHIIAVLLNYGQYPRNSTPKNSITTPNRFQTIINKNEFKLLECQTSKENGRF